MLPNSSLIRDSFINQPINIAINIPPRGCKFCTAIRSIESRKFLSPIIFTLDQRLKLRTDPMPIIHDKAEITIADFFLDKILSSDKNATPGSRIDIEELNAATDNNIKNMGPMNCPYCISLKADAKDTKTIPGPSPFSLS